MLVFNGRAALRTSLTQAYPFGALIGVDANSMLTVC